MDSLGQKRVPNLTESLTQSSAFNPVRVHMSFCSLSSGQIYRTDIGSEMSGLNARVCH